MVEADIVIADGTLLTVNKCWHSDLFWAIRGGGGGTFGVVTRAVYKAHDKDPNYYKFVGSMIDGLGDISKIMRAYVDWMDWTNENQPGQWGGYTFWGPYESYSTMLVTLMFIGEQSDA